MQPETLLAGRYRLERPIGAGGMGRVWAAHDTVLGRDVAIKSLDAGAVDKQALERFSREAKTAAALQHPNVVTIFDSGTDGATAFLVMELLPGPDLAVYLADRGALPEQEVIALAGQVVSGLAAAHAAGVVHRDIKPANLMFDARSRLKIVDFGIARLVHTGVVPLTGTNTVVGSAAYLSPEQGQGRAADERSDVYALGCVMTTMLTGRPPFEGEHPLAIVHQHINTPAPRISDRRPGISSALEQLVGAMLSKTPGDRPASASAVLDQLRGIDPRGIDDRPVSPAGTTEVLSPATLRLPTATAHVPARTRDLPLPGRMRLILVAAPIAVAALALFALTNPSGDAPVNGSAERGVGTSTTPSAAQTSARAQPPQTPARTQTRPTTGNAGGAGGLPGALSGLRAAVSAVARRGQIEAKKAEELDKRVDELTKKVAEEGGEDSAKQVEEMEKYLRELADKGELSEAGLQRIHAALQTVRARSA